MVKKIKEQRQGFTLIEVLAVIVIIAIITAIAVPSIKNVLMNSKRDTFGLSAQKVLDGVLQQEAIDDEFDATTINIETLETTLQMGKTNYQKLIITESNDKELCIYIEGKNKWDGLVACGTHDNITVVSATDNDGVCEEPENNSEI